MRDETPFPRVLFVTSHAFNHHTGGGVTFSKLFAGWPKDRLATIHNDPTPVAYDVCARYFVLGPDEIRKWGGLSRMTGYGAGLPSASDTFATDGGRTDGGALPIRRSLAVVRNALFGDSEFPEVVHLSPRLRQWIADFRPDVLYTILGNNSLMRLVDLVRTEYGLPLAVHFMDDWKSTAYMRGLLSPPRRRAMLSLIDRLVRAADVRMAICDAMSIAYRQEFGLSFTTFQNAVDPADWPPAEPEERGSGDPFTLFYGGAILPFAQLHSLVDVCRAVDSLSCRGLPVRFDIYAPTAMIETYRGGLAAGPAIHLHPSLADYDAYVREVRRADLLVLPVNFDTSSRRFIRYSMPTKVPEYLFSGVPILVYGPPDVAQTQYATSERWGHVLTESGQEGVANSVQRLAAHDDLRHSVLPQALAAARRNHDAAIVRERFRAALLGARSGQSSRRAR